MKPSPTCRNNILSLTFPQQSARKPSEKSQNTVQALINRAYFSFCLFSFFRFCVLNAVYHHQWNSCIRSDGVFLSISLLDSFVANSPIPDVMRSNASHDPNWRRRFHAPNSASQCEPVKVTRSLDPSISRARRESAQRNRHRRKWPFVTGDARVWTSMIVSNCAYDGPALSFFACLCEAEIAFAHSQSVTACRLRSVTRHNGAADLCTGESLWAGIPMTVVTILWIEASCSNISDH
jgi:hypothetical protein